MDHSKKAYRTQKALFIKRLEQARIPVEIETEEDSEKSKAMQAYGKRCNNCGNGKLDELELNHVNNNGKYHRMGISKGRAGAEFYRAIRLAGYPNAEPYVLEVLCKKCHTIQTSFNGRRKCQE